MRFHLQFEHSRIRRPERVILREIITVSVLKERSGGYAFAFYAHFSLSTIGLNNLLQNGRSKFEKMKKKG